MICIVFPFAKEKVIGYTSFGKESRREVQSYKHRAAGVLSTPYFISESTGMLPPVLPERTGGQNKDSASPS